MSPNSCFRGRPRVVLPWFIAPGPCTALPQHQGSSSAHFGPSLTSQLFLGSDLGPNHHFVAILEPPKSFKYESKRLTRHVSVNMST